jgi:hypothetical protein
MMVKYLIARASSPSPPQKEERAGGEEVVRIHGDELSPPNQRRYV